MEHHSVMKFSVGIDHFIERLLYYVPNLTDAKGIELQIGLGAVRVWLLGSIMARLLFISWLGLGILGNFSQNNLGRCRHFISLCLSSALVKTVIFEQFDIASSSLQIYCSSKMSCRKWGLRTATESPHNLHLSNFPLMCIVVAYMCKIVTRDKNL